MLENVFQGHGCIFDFCFRLRIINQKMLRLLMELVLSLELSLQLSMAVLREGDTEFVLVHD